MWKKIKSAQERKNTFRIKKELWIPVFVLMIGLVVLVNIGIRADSSQRDLIRSRAELNAVTYADHMKADIVRGIDITNTFEQIVISENGKISMFSKVAENMMADYVQSIQIAPDGVVTEIYPEDGNKAGKIDLIHDKERGKISCYARDNDVITMLFETGWNGDCCKKSGVCGAEKWRKDILGIYNCNYSCTGYIR